MRSEIINKIMDAITIDTKIKIGNQMAFINLIHELGFRENKMWPSDEADHPDNELLKNIILLSDAHTERQMEKINTELYALRKENEELKDAIKSRNILQEEYKNELSSQEAENHHKSQLITELRKRCEDLEAELNDKTLEVQVANTSIDLLSSQNTGMREALDEVLNYAVATGHGINDELEFRCRKLLSDEREG